MTRGGCKYYMPGRIVPSFSAFPAISAVPVALTYGARKRRGAARGRVRHSTPDCQASQLYRILTCSKCRFHITRLSVSYQDTQASQNRPTRSMCVGPAPTVGFRKSDCTSAIVPTVQASSPEHRGCMNQNTDRLILSGLLLVVIAACGYDSSAPYNPPASVDGLWTSSAVDPAIVRFDPSQLALGGRRAPSTRISTASADLLDLNGLAFDSDGTMWVASSDDSLLIALAPQSLARSGNAVATTVISSNDRSLSRPVAIAFDNQHRLWVANFANQTVVRFEHSQLATSGAAVPTLAINTGVNPSSLAFDAGGNLWVASIQANKIFSYNRLQQQTANVVEPQIVISTNGTALQHPSGLAFDAAGNLWVASLTQARIDAFTPAQLAVSGSPDPAVSITSSDSSIDEPVALAFDNEGSLWVMNGANGQLSKFPRAALAQTASRAPALTLTPAGYTLFWSIAFWPKPAGLPLN